MRLLAAHRKQKGTQKQSARSAQREALRNNQREALRETKEGKNQEQYGMRSFYAYHRKETLRERIGKNQREAVRRKKPRAVCYAMHSIGKKRVSFPFLSRRARSARNYKEGKNEEQYGMRSFYAYHRKEKKAPAGNY